MTVEREWFASAAEPNGAPAAAYLDLLSFEMVAFAVLLVAGAMLAFQIVARACSPSH